MTEDRSPVRAGGPAQPLDDDAFDRLMDGLGPFERAPHVAVAVSGGADSLALALFAGRWAARRGGRATALTVDHGLRPEAAAETRRVGRWLAPRSIAHHVLRWRGPKPATGVQAAARDARYRLMGTWCREAGVLHLLLAHTLDDQAETLLMRLAAGSGPDGLAAMSAVRETPDGRLLRPLLAVPKSALTAALDREGQGWIEDPSNRDDAFTRTRVRRAMAQGGLDAGPLALAAHRFGRARQALEASASALLARTAWVHPAGFARIDRGPLAAVPDEVGLRAFARVLAAVGGRPHRPRLDKLERLFAALAAGAGGTLAGCRLAADGEEVVVARETRGLPDPVAVRPGLRLAWDRRFAIAFGGPGGGKARPRLTALGRRGWSEIVQIRPDLRASTVPGPARTSLPALVDVGGVIEVPHLGYRRPDGSRTGVEFSDIRFRPPETLSSVGFFLLNPPDILSL
ncbi:MAG: tRNA lysidine(34) synthetase TilS [Rhodospirillales bacterium]